MSQISSINFKKSTDFQVFHNANIRPSYAIGGVLQVNRNGYEAKNLKETIINEAKQAYTEHTGQKFQAKSYEWSAVVNIKPGTSMQDLELLAKHFQEKYGFQCYQIAIHRDEGHINDDGEKVINHHAHLEFITLDKETGKSLFRAELQRPKALREIQTEVAQILKMDRGVDKRLSGAKRIEPRAYAQLKEQERKSFSRQKEFNDKEAQNEALKLSLKEQKQLIEQFRKACKNKGLTKEFYRELSLFKEQEPTSKDELDELLKELLAKHTEKDEIIHAQKIRINELENPLNEISSYKKGDPDFKSKLIEQVYGDTLKSNLNFKGIFFDKERKSFSKPSEKWEFIDKGDEIVAKDFTKESVNLMIMVALSKGWELETLEAVGSDKFKKEFDRQIKERIKKKHQSELYQQELKLNKELEALKAENQELKTKLEAQNIEKEKESIREEPKQDRPKKDKNYYEGKFEDFTKKKQNNDLER